MDIFDQALTLLSVEYLDTIILLLSIGILCSIQFIQNKRNETNSKLIQHQLTVINQKLEIQSTVAKQSSDSFSNIQEQINNLDEVVTMVNRDISNMTESINGEVGISKAIEMARQGLSAEEISGKTNLSLEQAELIYKFHGEK